MALHNDWIQAVMDYKQNQDTKSPSKLYLVTTFISQHSPHGYEKSKKKKLKAHTHTVWNFWKSYFNTSNATCNNKSITQIIQLNKFIHLKD